MFPWICTLRSRDVWRLLLVVDGILLMGARKELRSSLLMIYLSMVSIYTSFLGFKTLLNLWLNMFHLFWKILTFGETISNLQKNCNNDTQNFYVWTFRAADMTIYNPWTVCITRKQECSTKPQDIHQNPEINFSLLLLANPQSPFKFHQ